jgi:dihydroorotate dehydrogenase electron transfer subunit
LTFWGHPAQDAGLAWLRKQPVQSPVDLLGPLGNGFAVHMQQQHLLLVSESVHVAPLLALIGPQLGRGGSVGLLMEGATHADLLPAAVLPPAVEYYTATADGSAGHPGDLSDLLPTFLSWADLVCAAGSTPFLRRLKRAIGETRFSSGAGLAQVLAPVPLPCGIGACLACLVDTGRGWCRACQRGPVFDLVELAL